MVRQRVLNQQLARPRFEDPADVVRWTGAVQAQDYAGGLWAIGLRTRASTEAAVEQAIASRAIVRTWPMRRTLHLVPAEDVRWMLRLLASRSITRAASRHRFFELTPAVFKKSRRALERALGGGRALTRPDAYATLERAGVATADQRGIHILAQLAHEGLLCFGARAGRQPTFVLLDEWVPEARSKSPSREEALALLAKRYFASHGPASIADFAWWSSLTIKDARAAVESNGTSLVREPDGRITTDSRPAGRLPAVTAALLPPWDEYVVAYRERTGVLEPRPGVHPLGTIGRPLIVLNGVVRGTWGRTRTAKGVMVQLEPWTRLTAPERRALAAAVARYGEFVGRSVSAAPY